MNSTRKLTEDDTFAALQKPDLHMMLEKWNNFTEPLDVSYFVTHHWQGVRALFFEKHHWTWDEFHEARKQYYLLRSK